MPEVSRVMDAPVLYSGPPMPLLSELALLSALSFVRSRNALGPRGT